MIERKDALKVWKNLDKNQQQQVHQVSSYKELPFSVFTLSTSMIHHALQEAESKNLDLLSRVSNKD